MKETYAFIMMIKDKWWREFCNLNKEGKKTLSYVHGWWGVPKNTTFIFFYVTKPIGKIAGYAEFVERKVGDAESLWKQHGEESALRSKEKYEEFIRDTQRVSFVRFRNLHETTKPIPLNNLLMLLGARRLARGGFYINKEIADKLITLMT